MLVGERVAMHFLHRLPVKSCLRVAILPLCTKRHRQWHHIHIAMGALCPSSTRPGASLVQIIEWHATVPACVAHGHTWMPVSYRTHSHGSQSMDPHALDRCRNWQDSEDGSTDCTGKAAQTVRTHKQGLSETGSPEGVRALCWPLSHTV